MPHGHVLQVLVLVITKHAVLLCVLISLLVFLVLLFILLVLVLVSPLLVVLVLSVLLPLADVQLWNLDHFVELLRPSSLRVTSPFSSHFLLPSFASHSRSHA